jgi:hypothetical protein
MLKAALRYARAEWPIFPCKPGEKVPLSALAPNGFKNATINVDTITDWWSRCPDANIGLATGAPGPDVVDFDVKSGKPGQDSYERLRDAGLLRGAHAVITTPSGGFHLYYLGSEQGNAVLHRHGVDFRSVGGYVVAPPSTTPAGSYRRTDRRSRYSSQARRVDFGAIRRHLDPPRRGLVLLTSGGAPHNHDALIRYVANQGEGNRNAGLYWAACRAAETSAGEDVFDALASAAVSAGLQLREAYNTIRSAKIHIGVPA